jgi:hypothetical protein
VEESRNQRGPYFTAFSLHIPDMRFKIAKICARSLRVQIEPMFRYRTPKSGRLLVETRATLWGAEAGSSPFREAIQDARRAPAKRR